MVIVASPNLPAARASSPYGRLNQPGDRDSSVIRAK
jgi:hypothetical protein